MKYFSKTNIINAGVSSMLSLLFVLIFYSCSQIKLNVDNDYHNHVENMKKVYKNSTNSPYPNQNFIHLKKYILRDDDGNMCYLKKATDALVDPVGCEKKELYTTASGMAITRKGNEIYAMTAAHWCNVELDELFYISKSEKLKDVVYPRFSVEVDFYGKTHKGEIKKIDKDNDLCLVKFTSKFSKKIKEIKVAKQEPKIGDNLYTVAAPLSIENSNIRLHFDGKYAGCGNKDFEIDFCLYTIPAIYGSSGSGVLNKKGELVGMISISIIDFKQVSGGPSVDDIRYFLEDIKE